jgi:hypothetical protein
MQNVDGSELCFSPAAITDEKRYQSTRGCEARLELHPCREARFEMFHEPTRCIRHHPSGAE